MFFKIESGIWIGYWKNILGRVSGICVKTQKVSSGIENIPIFSLCNTFDYYSKSKMSLMDRFRFFFFFLFVRKVSDNSIVQHI